MRRETRSIVRSRVFSLLAPHLPWRQEFLQETYASIVEQNVSWEWIIEVEGESDIAKEILRDERVLIRENEFPLSPPNY